MRRRDLLALGAILAATPALGRTPPAFPGALGWAAATPGGRGGAILKVTTLAADGPGSLAEALAVKGPRIVVFEVGGVIDLGARSLKIREPFLTLAGQTAPAPGITLIRGGLTVATHDVIIRHIRIRPGEAGAAKLSGWECDGLATDRARDVIVDHCSFSWATDEGLSASGPRFEGATPDDWRAATSHGITFSNNIVAEGLSNATHSKGEHSKGSLVHDNVTGVLIVGNLYAHNRERNPLFKGGARGAVVNNLIYDPGKRGVHFNLHAKEWGDHPHQPARLALVGNVLRAGPSTADGVAMMMVGGQGPIDLHMADNLALDRQGAPLPQIANFGGSTIAPTVLARPADWPLGLAAKPAREVEAAVLRNAGARPWDRDAVDARIVAEVIARTGAIRDSEQAVGGYPAPAPTRRVFDPASLDA
ncbi:polysaccharide lyase family 1 protein [Phenylobacterium sp.]|uniref:pectate lyase family protein n=1 Tax=Phenylobacterium sp. TaxID=1871053 RepID=UPI0027337FCE|nr:pectate lyase [Phenylobacterium sp.]MDP3852144.1 pectate lyase [Phenylobacterium sp.]